MPEAPIDDPPISNRNPAMSWVQQFMVRAAERATGQRRLKGVYDALPDGETRHRPRRDTFVPGGQAAPTAAEGVDITRPGRIVDIPRALA